MIEWRPEWRPERLPVGSTLSVAGRDGADFTALLRDLVSRMHERYDDCFVYTSEPGEWVGMGCHMMDDIDQLFALLVPGPARLLVMHREGLEYTGPDEDLERFGVTIIYANTVKRCRPGTTGVVFWRPSTLHVRGEQPGRASLLRVLAYAQPNAHKRLSAMGTEALDRLVESLDDGRALVVTSTDESWYRPDPDPPRPHWQPWTTVNRAAGRPALPEGDSPVALDVVALVARQVDRDADLAATCRQWRRAVDEVPRLAQVRYSPRFGTPAGVPNVARRPDRPWDGELRRIDPTIFGLGI
jgi:hypothetical protein